MSEQNAKPERRDLLGGIKPRNRAPVDEKAILAVAAANGFAREDKPAEIEPPSPALEVSAVSQNAAQPAPDRAPSAKRRMREKSPYTENFSTRISVAANNAIYDEANARQISVSKVMDEMVQAWLASKQN